MKKSSSAKKSPSPQRDGNHDGQRDGNHDGQRDGHGSRKDLRELRNATLKGARARTAELLATNVDLRKEIAQRTDRETDLLSVIDRAQQRLGQELHDGLCQQLTALAFMSRALAGRLRNAQRIEPDEIDNLTDLINESVGEARAIARGLHPVEMNPGGLASALNTLAKKKHWAVPVRFEGNGPIPVKDDITALHFYRIASEAILNANKHSRAREIVVKVKVSKHEIVLKVCDDGVGVSPRARRGMGFHIMEYRAQSIGGKLLIERLKPRGTCVTCRLPRQ